MINYEGLIIRPPSEARSLILQATVGCSHNACTFCPAYKQKSFFIRPDEALRSDIDACSRSGAHETRRVFLCDGDPLIMPTHRLLALCDYIAASFPRLQRIGMYANAKSILMKSAEELEALRRKKLTILYMGVESGDQTTLERVQKGADTEQMLQAARRVRHAGMKLNVSVILGLGGRERTREHARETMLLLNSMQPDYVGALTLMLVPGTQLHAEYEQKRFVVPDKFELVEELRTMVAAATMEKCLFFSNHASNYFPVKAVLSRDREKILRSLDQVLARRDDRFLRPEELRAL